MLLLLFVFLAPVTYTGLASAQRDFLSSRKFKCYSCTSVNATQIVGGAGVDPGVFLSTIKLGNIPITTRCRDDFNPDLAIRAGADTPFCDDGLCVKINYTDKLTGQIDVLRACLPESQGVFKRTCASFSSSQALGTWCVCGNQFCNSAERFSKTMGQVLGIAMSVIIFSMASLLFA